MVLAMSPAIAERLFDEESSRRLAAVADLDAEIIGDVDSERARRSLSTAEVLLTGWGGPPITEGVLRRAPHLRAIASMGGATGVDPTYARERGIRLVNARRANSIPVAEFAVAAILWAGKETFRSSRLYRERRSFIDREGAFPDAGNNGRRIGLVGASTVGRLVIEMLRPFDLLVDVCDPYLSPEEAHALGVRKVDLEALLTGCAVVSLHAPEVPQTRGMIGERELRMLADGAVLINTARGALVDTDALVAELRTGRIDAVLDVTEPEPLPPDHPLWAQPNAVLTPHIAGSMGNEIARLGERIVEEIELLWAGEPARESEI